MGQILAYANEQGRVYAVDAEGKDGVWRTIRGSPVFIREGESATQAILRRKNKTEREKDLRSRGVWEVYHGTTENVAKQIKREGLKPGEKSRRNFSGEDVLYRGKRSRAVFVTESENGALSYAMSARRTATDRGFKVEPVIIKIHIPLKVYDKEFKPDMHNNFGDAPSAWAPRGIPPEWIKGIYSASYAKGGLGKRLLSMLEEVKEVFVVALILNSESVDDFVDSTVSSHILAFADAEGRVTPSTAGQDARSRVLQPQTTLRGVLAYADAAGHVYAEWDERRQIRSDKGHFQGIRHSLYVSRPVLNADEIIAWAKSAGFTTTLPAEDMHVTVCYSKEPVDWLALEHWADTLEIPPEGVRTLAEERGVWRTVNGRHVFIKEGEDFDTALKRSLGEDKPKTDKELVSVLEKKALGFDLMQSKYWASERRGEDYKNKMSILIPLAKKHGVDRAIKMYNAARVYTSTFYGRMNNSLRAGQVPKNVDLIDQYITTAPKVSVDQVFRGVGPDMFSKLKSGKAVKDLAFISTTTNRSVAETFGKRRGKGGILEISGVKGVAAKIPEQDEGEFLLPRGSSFRVVSISGNVAKLELVKSRNHEVVDLFEFDQHSYADRTITNLGDDGAVVLQFESQPLQARHQYFLDQGASWDYDGYHPHITLTYEAPEGLDLSTVEPYTGRIVLGPEKFTELETGWAEDIEELAQEDGVWRTVRGRKVFIREGEDLDTALKRSLEKTKKSSPLTVYHGTSTEALAEIKRDGLVVRSDKRVFDRGMYKGGRKNSVFVTKSFSEAESYGRNAIGNLDWRSKASAVVLKIEIPAGESIKFKPDELNPNTSLRYEGRIPKDWIKEVVVYKRYGPVEKIEKLAVTDNAFWVVLIAAEKDPSEVKEHTNQPTQPFEIDYAQIKNDLDAMEAKFRDALREVLVQSRDAMMAKVRKGKAGNIKELKLPYTADIQQAIGDALQRAMDRGEADASKEIGRARKQVKEHTLRTYAKVPTFTPRAALKWLRAKVFWVTDVLTGGLLEDIRLAIINGLKTGKPTDSIITDIAQVYIPYLGDHAAVKDGELPTAARLETVVRTNLVESYNQGRIATFIKPDMMPFLDGIRYSAILDTRTTPVCRYLHERIFKPEDIQATGLVPPNHFQCRSLVVPVVVGEISKPPDFKVDPKVYITDEEILHAQALADAKFLEQAEDDVHTHEWDESRHPRDEQGQWATIGIPKQSMESPKLHLDNPGGDWLAYERERSSGSGRDAYGAPNRWGEVTGSFSDDVLIPIDKLSQVPGLRGEQQNVRQGSLEDLMSHMREKGRLPLGRLGGEYVPFIQVAYDGSAWMNEGNHRVMAAKALGWKYLPVEIRYFAGGEQAEGEWAPEKLLSEDAGLRNTKRYAQEDAGVWRTVRGRKVFIREGETPTEAVKRSIAERTQRSIHSHIPATKARQLKAAQYEETVAKLISGKNLDDHEPFDVIKGQHAVEVKTILPGAKNSKVTVHPDSLARKNTFLRKEKMTGHTVVIDARGPKPVYYYREGVGSFRLDNMRTVKGVELKGLMK